MIDHELTDPAGGALTITHDHQGVWITATEDREEVTVGPFPVTSLTEAVTVESDAEVSDDLMDGGVTAAAIEAEVVSPERARSLVQERDELAEALDTTMGRAIKAERERDEAKAFATLWKRTAREQVRRTRNIAGRTRVQADYIGRLRREVEKARQQGDVDPLPIIDEVARQDGEIHELRKQLEDVERAATASPRPLTADDVDEDALDRAQEVWETAHGWEDVRETLGRALRAALTEPTRPEGAEEIEALLTGSYAEPRYVADFLASHGVRVVTEEQP